MSNSFETVERNPEFVSIGREQLYINHALWSDHFGGVKAIQYLAAPDVGQLAVVESDADNENAYMASAQAGDMRGCQFGCARALTRLGVSLDERVRPPYEWDDELGALLIDLSAYQN